MPALTFSRATAVAPRAPVAVVSRTLLALACVLAAAAPIAARWIPDASVRTTVGIAIVLAYIAFAVFARAEARLREVSQVALALVAFALVWLLNGSLPAFVAANLLHEQPTAENPFASTVTGTVVAQLLETVLTIVPVLIFARFIGRDRAPNYVRAGVLGRWLMAAVVFFVIFYLFVATIPLRPGSFAQRFIPLSGALSLERFIALSPALLIMALSNGFEEEFLFRGLLLPTFNWIFNPWTANVLQASLFAFAHLGVTYTPSATVFALCVILPLGLIAGYLVRKTQGLLTTALFHAGLDIAIFVTFLSAAT
jgi:membrane protease YdiL (CAAX protease family)